jgi:hypothetical protein
MDILSNPRYAIPAAHFEMACAASRAHNRLAAIALATYGDHGALISGCVRTHFPETIKDTLRTLARACSDHSDNGYAARPAGVHASTMVKLARAVATRDGSGYYGPQPL